MTGTLAWFIITILTSYLNSKHSTNSMIFIFLHSIFLSFLFFGIDHNSRITHLKLLWLAHKGGGRHRFCRHSWSRCRQPEASSREKNFLGDWLTTNSDLIVCVISFWQQVFTNLQLFTILIAIKDNYHNAWHHQIFVPMSSPCPHVPRAGIFSSTLKLKG